MSQENSPEQVAAGPKFCPNCGTPLEGNPKFCPKCGSQLGTPPAENPVDPNVGQNAPSPASTGEAAPTPQPTDGPIPTTQPGQTPPAMATPPMQEVPPKKKSGAGRTVLIVVIVVIVILAIAGISSGGGSSSGSSSSASTSAPAPEEVNESDYQWVPYATVARNPDGYKGQNLAFNGEVLQVQESSDETDIRLAVNGDYNDVVMVGFNPSIVQGRVLENDYITVYGQCAGLYSYEAVLGNQVSVPALWADKVVINGMGG